ncbi:protein takeout isoform X1 [Solenopsis invicta]|uniref:protein takeout isoform X1 n=2 Tax=Solenopsis invicta TaxID=13686 RepID=UPI00193E244B|nr:protein takeout isoform X1 [Solenopsis invicta]XP_039304677.1 protein takeout isoform X1 [Solenopsis invicta]
MFAEILAFVILAAPVTSNLPSYIHACGRNTSSVVYGQCIVDNIDNLKSMICNEGLPEFDVPPSGSLTIDKLVIYDTNNLKWNVTDVKMRGFCDLNVNSINVSTDKLHFKIDMMSENIILDAMYNFDIQLLVPLANKGLIHVTLDNSTNKVDVELKEVMKNGVTEIYASKIKSKIDVIKFSFEFNDEEEGSSQQLHKILSQIINDNSKEIINMFKPIVEEMISKLILSIFNKITYNRFKQLFPDEA